MAGERRKFPPLSLFCSAEFIGVFFTFEAYWVPYLIFSCGGTTFYCLAAIFLFVLRRRIYCTTAHIFDVLQRAEFIVLQHTFLMFYSAMIFRGISSKLIHFIARDTLPLSCPPSSLPPPSLCCCPLSLILHHPSSPSSSPITSSCVLVASCCFF